MDSVRNSDMTGYKEFLSSETLSSRLCKSAERVPNTLLFKSQSDRPGERAGQDMSPGMSIFLEKSVLRMQCGQSPSDPCFIK